MEGERERGEGERERGREDTIKATSLKIPPPCACGF